MSSVVEIQLEAFKTIAWEVYLYERVLVATLTILVAEFFQTIDAEVRFVWKLKLSLANVLYLLNRYVAPINIAFAVYVFGIATDKSTTYCYNGYVASASLCFFQMQVAYAVLCIRACAAWGFKRIINICLTISFIASFVTEGYLIGRYIASDFAVPAGALGTKHCLIFTPAHDIVWIALVILVGVDVLALSLLLVKSLKTFRQSRLHTSLLTVMAKDGIAYFACVFALSLGNLLVIVTPVPIFKEMFLLTQAAFQNALAVRLLLHLRTVNEDSDPLTRGTMSELQIKQTTEMSDFSTLETMG
ncbi:hypothetical protein SCHPADRAFT_997808 [Schizopora paradoxa]|uniref:DUF6533 domain-containing protein n=1 Tax=Schizopora paradoxa TaxID=27342 RepID=A0A0H2RM13_9AGAM|nr:hypothetical protein SCHPADRAFT_997808 [Schizopora paradoxa]